MTVSGSLTSSRIRSAVRTPPGSRSSCTWMPRSPSAAASPVFPAPSTPSIVISRPRLMVRRYRGITSEAVLAELDRHPHARAVLRPALDADGQPSHAYLFHGPGGSGKRSVARAVASELLAAGSADPASARARAISGAHPDLTWVSPSGAHEILVSDIDQPVVAAASKTPFESARRVFVIERVDELGDEAANRMLKTLEEPASYVHMILLTERLTEVLPTISSRCQLVRFDAPPLDQVAGAIEARGIAPDTAQACARLAFGDLDRAAELAGERSEEHTSELQSHVNLVCRLLLEKKKKQKYNAHECDDKQDETHQE